MPKDGEIEGVPVQRHRHADAGIGQPGFIVKGETGRKYLHFQFDALFGGGFHQLGGEFLHNHPQPADFCAQPAAHAPNLPCGHGDAEGFWVKVFGF